MEYTNDVVSVFDEKIEKYSKTQVDKRILSFTRETLLDDSLYNEDEVTILDEKLLSDNISEIKKGMLSMHSCKQYNKLKDKLEGLEKMSKEYLKVEERLDSMTSRSYNELWDMSELLKLQIIYSIIELKVSIGLQITGIAEKHIIQYCNSIAHDVNNDTYETLTIEDHIDEDEVKISNPKVKRK